MDFVEKSKFVLFVILFRARQHVFQKYSLDGKVFAFGLLLIFVFIIWLELVSILLPSFCDRLSVILVVKTLATY